MNNNMKGYNTVSVLERASYTKMTNTERVTKKCSVFELSVYGRGSDNIDNLWRKLRKKIRTN